MRLGLMTGTAAAAAMMAGPMDAVRAAAASSAPVQLPTMAILSDRVANQRATATFTMPVTLLRFEPGVDVQERNLAEGQADLAIRGGTFENTGFLLAGAPLYDPQTGHYSAEIPIPPAMLGVPRLLTGAEQTRSGWNATAGSVAYAWAPVTAGGSLELGAGVDATYRASLLVGAVGEKGGIRIGAQLAGGWSQSDGPIVHGDHRFARAAARLRLETDGAATDLLVARQEKFFGWVNLYTPFNSPESEDLRTTLVALSHRRAVGTGGGHFAVTAYHRENYDDYRFNRFAPVGPVKPFEHTTNVAALFADGRWVGPAEWAVGYRLGALADRIESTSLTFGRFDSRTHLTAGLFPEWRRGTAGGEWTVIAGTSVDDTNRDPARVSPAASVTWDRGAAGWRQLSLSYAETSQVAGYTALNASPSAGLFRGNPTLGRSVSRNLEFGTEVRVGSWETRAVVFRRQDDRLVDWTFRRGVTARLARAVAIETTGVEGLARRSWGWFESVLSYAWLEKDADYGAEPADASFYALNFPEHRLTAAGIVRRGDWELRIDNEYRRQQANPLRTIGGDEALLTTASLSWRPAAWRGVTLSVHIDNAWDEDFQEVPAVPAAGRQYGVGVAYGW